MGSEVRGVGRYLQGSKSGARFERDTGRSRGDGVRGVEIRREN